MSPAWTCDVLTSLLQAIFLNLSSRSSRGKLALPFSSCWVISTTVPVVIRHLPVRGSLHFPLDTDKISITDPFHNGAGSPYMQQVGALRLLTRFFLTFAVCSYQKEAVIQLLIRALQIILHPKTEKAVVFKCQCFIKRFFWTKNNK